jgi:DNA modification methylase
MLVDGHLRAALDPDLEVPVLVLDLNEAEASKMMVTLDPLAAMAETNRDALSALLNDGATFDSEAINKMLADLMGVKEPKVGLTDPDDVPLVAKRPYVKRGQVYQLGAHRVMCGDATVDKDYAKLMDGKMADLIFTDPPYGVGYDGGAKERDRLIGDELGSTIYGDALPRLAAYAADHAALYLWYADARAASAAAATAGYVVVAQIVWVKNNAQFVTAAHYKGKHEACLYAHRKGKSSQWFGPNNEVTVWPVDRSNRNEYHPTQKPVELAEHALRNSSQTGDVVIDPFLGSGATMIAAERLERACYGMDIEPKYVQVAIKRWEDYTGQKAVKVG